MTETLRSISITHPAMPNATFRIGVSTPSPFKGQDQVQQVVIELHVRNNSGATEVAGSLTLDKFEDLASEIIRVGSRVLPKQSDG